MTDRERLDYLKQMASEVLEACTFEQKCDYLRESEIMRIAVPSGDGKYPSFWVRDCAMMAESGLFSREDWKRYIQIIARHGVNGPETKTLANGLSAPPFAVADHINYDGKPVFFPGTYSSGDDQGCGRCGFLPPLCDNYLFLSMAAEYLLKYDDPEVREELEALAEPVWNAYCIDAETGLCACDEAKRAVDWGFCDLIVKTGKLLFPSLFRLWAARLLAKALGNPEYDRRADNLAIAIRETFFEKETGWLLSATEIGAQPDVWGTACAICYGVLVGKDAKAAANALMAAYRSGDAVKDGYIRHVPKSRDFSEDSAWECAPGLAKGNYQNGAWWSTATGWYVYALNTVSPEAARDLMDDFILHTKKHRVGGSPYEFFRDDDGEPSGLNYGTSAALPFTWFKKMLEAESN
ncbi:MAG TPA: hypothetical protein PK629_00845 [Oscillospiraceae bacterium]|nr:hypothetical protein [Oscillospiraceae bacterium]HPK34511.1 hypothetical protein [Oscillospiraceae bacterium]HPR74739.1 hypothetical protein [Oscillospiraceae bacterium]